MKLKEMARSGKKRRYKKANFWIRKNRYEIKLKKTKWRGERKGINKQITERSSTRKTEKIMRETPKVDK